MKKHLSRGRALTAILLLSLSLAACGGDDDNSPPTQPEVPGTPGEPGNPGEPGTPQEPQNPQLHCAP